MTGVYPQGIHGLIGKGGAKEDTDINQQPWTWVESPSKVQHWRGWSGSEPYSQQGWDWNEALASGITFEEVSKSS